MPESEPIRVYADTSVFGGPFDDEFRNASLAFFDEVRAGRIRLVTSVVVASELDSAPDQVRDLFDEVASGAEVVEVTPAALALQQAYLDSGILTEKWSDDALHVALASAARCDAIASWNFKHIVNYRRIPLYSAVNALHALPPLRIHAPPELIDDRANPNG